MALQMATNILPDAVNGDGSGVFDAASGLDVSWQVNGQSGMVAYRIVLKENDTESTVLYTTGKITLQNAFYGIDYNGDTVRFEANTITAANLSGAGIANGNDYKMVITQWWGATDDDSITQVSASMIEARAVPTVTMNAIASPITSHKASFTATASIDGNDSIAWVRWYLAYTGNDDNPFYDSGDIYGTPILRMDYDTLMTGTAYDVKCELQTASGQKADTGWISFSVSYQVSAPTGEITVYQSCERSGLMVVWTAHSGADGYSLFRTDKDENKFTHIGEFDSDTISFLDYGTKNGHTYVYTLYVVENDEYSTSALSSEKVKACKWDWALLRAQMQSDGICHVQAEYLLSCNVDSGNGLYNNVPKIQATFGKYPNWQGTSSLYASGTIKALVGKINKTTNQYEDDTASRADEMAELGTTDDMLFLKDRKGNLRLIRLNGSITTTIEDDYPNQATQITLPWVEVGDADECVIIATAEDGMFNTDTIVATTLAVDAETGVLSLTYSNTYLAKENYGSRLRLDGSNLTQYSDSAKLSMASMEIVRDSERLFANNDKF